MTLYRLYRVRQKSLDKHFQPSKNEKAKTGKVGSCGVLAVQLLSKITFWNPKLLPLVAAHVSPGFSEGCEHTKEGNLRTKKIFCAHN
ncbi:hypothetical protein Y032_0908g2986 [Ancylostoma ceylanicum]|uniref:Uncharacterized protein n=1 Tax=Ancylostoma ceylanicum TaxID=53326 RepID=A0A016W8Z1_9BILA|nr:hypothetical protein Y032_0908g2986 [Ancylostoma ceylanicum]